MPDDFDYSARPERINLNRAPTNPILTQILCILCVVITLAYWTSDSMKGTLWYGVGHFGVQSAEQIWDGHYYALFTSFFTHLDIMHLVFNMIWIWRLGSIVETTIPRWKYILFLMGAALVSSCSELALSGQTGAGASGVGYALFGLVWAGRGAFTSWRQVATRENLNLFIGWGLFCIFLTYSHIMSIGNGAHGGGFLFGLAIGWLCFAPRSRPAWGIVLAALGIVCVMAFTWLPWSWQWNWHCGSTELKRRHYKEAITLYQRSMRQGGDASSLWTNIGIAWEGVADDAVSRNDAKAAEYAEQQAAAAQQQAGTSPRPEGQGQNTSDPAQDTRQQHVERKSNSGQ